jgi:hypothetical protein
VKNNKFPLYEKGTGIILTSILKNLKLKTQNSKLKTYKKSFYETKKNSFYLSPIGIGDIGLFLV